MATWLTIYLVGFLVAMYFSVKVIEEDGRITFGDLAIAFFMSLFSWIMVIALWLGGNIKHAEDHRNDNLK